MDSFKIFKKDAVQFKKYTGKHFIWELKEANILIYARLCEVPQIQSLLTEMQPFQQYAY